jgi:hypothetical protein
LDLTARPLLLHDSLSSLSSIDNSGPAAGAVQINSNPPRTALKSSVDYN